ncbi:MAG: DUF4384 domain-containing protein [Alphaproteobacteria bacterium]|nr:DUF4384 domain-containing protein [Alphaproteobacteria bacterium]
MFVALVTAATTAPLSQGEKGIVAVARDAPSPPEGYDVRAVVVGVGAFPGLGEAAGLPWAEQDARRFSMALDSALRVDDLALLTGPQATQARVRDALQSALLGADADEVVIVYLATHGARIDREGVLLLQDSRPGQALAGSSLALRELKALVQRSPARQVWLIVDPVHQSLPGLVTGPDEAVSPLVSAIGAERDDVMVITATGVSTASQGEPACAGLSAFACGVISAMQGSGDLDEDGIAEAAELLRAVPPLVGQLSGGAAGAEGGGRPDTLGLPDVSPQKVAAAVSAEVEVCLYANRRPVPANHRYRTGDVFSVRMTVPQDGHLKLVNVGPDGATHLLYPLQSPDDTVRAGSAIWALPHDHDLELRLVPPAGTERVVALWSPGPLEGAEAVEAFAAAWVAAAPEAQREMAGRKGIQVFPVEDAAGERCVRHRPVEGEAGWVLEVEVVHG